MSDLITRGLSLVSNSLITRGLSLATSVDIGGRVLDIYPAPDATGIPIGDQIYVRFNREMDLSSINTGTFVVIAPENTDVFGPDLQSADEIANSDQNTIYSSLPLNRYVSGTIIFRQVDADGNLINIEDELTDTEGDGTLWGTLAIFVPDKPLNPNIEYTVLLSGDESDDSFSSGIRNRTIFDPIEDVYGTGTISFVGGYTGETQASYTVEIINGGITGVATYRWWNNASPLITFDGITVTGRRTLENGIEVEFGPDGTFQTGDSWQVVCIPAISIETSYRWTFTTGSGSIITPPSSFSTTGIESLAVGSTTSSFSVTDISPDQGEYGVPIIDSSYDGNTITITFGTNSEIEETSLIGNIDLYSESSTGETDITATGELEFTYTLTGNVLVLEILPGQLYLNNIVVLTLGKNIQNTDSEYLGENYQSYFSTIYTPLYSSYRRVMLDLGQAIVNMDKEPIMLAILIASRQADEISFSPIINSQYYEFAKKQYTTCLAEFLLIRGLLFGGAGDKLSKRLADLSVSRDKSSLSDLKQDLEDCFKEWEIVIQSGGTVTPNSSLSPGYSVKGALAEDAITVGRLWEPTHGYAIPAANSNVYRTARRTNRSFRTRR